MIFISSQTSNMPLPVTPVRLNPTDLDLSSTRGGPKMKALVNDGVNTIKIKLLVLNMISSPNQKHE